MNDTVRYAGGTSVRNLLATIQRAIEILKTSKPTKRSGCEFLRTIASTAAKSCCSRPVIIVTVGVLA